MVRVSAIDRSFAATPRTHPRNPMAAARRWAPADFDVPTRGFTHELPEIDRGMRVRERVEPRSAWLTSGRGRLVDILA